MGFWSDTFGGGNSFKESVANTFTQDDGYSYERGDLIDSDGQVVAKDDPRRGGINNLGSADNEKTNRTAYESRPSVTPAGTNNDGSSTDRPVTGLRSLAPFIGGAMLGPIGVAGGLAYKNSNFNFGSNPNNIPTIEPRKAAQIKTKELPVYTDAQIKELHRTGKVKTPEGRIQGSFFKNEGDQDDPNAPMYKMNRFGNTYRVDRTGQNYGNSSLIAEQAAAAGGDNDGIAAVRRSVGTQATAPTNNMPAISTESEFAKQQVLSPPAEWLIENGYADTNPSYEAIRKYNTDKRAGVLTMREGGSLGQMQIGQMPLKGDSSGQMGGLNQYGAYLDNRYGDPEFDQKRAKFLNDVGQQEQQTFGGGGGGSFPSSGLGGKGGAGSSADGLTQVLFDNKEVSAVDPVEQAPTNSLYKGLSPVFGGAMGGARAALGMAEGGDVEFALGGNEKDLINAAERAVRNGLQAQGMARGGDMDISNEDKIAIAQYVEQYGKPALMQLVDSVRTGEADETRKRFASGENGEVRGNGDGSGTDDKITAQLKDGDATQDVLLADGEFVLRKDAYEALKDAGVNVDKVNDAGSNAAKELNKMMTA